MLLTRISTFARDGGTARTLAVAALAGVVLGCTLWLVVAGDRPAAADFAGGYRPHTLGGCALALGLSIGGLTFFGTVPLAGYVAFSAGVMMVMAACGP